jgi:hypothetical protein
MQETRIYLYSGNIDEAFKAAAKKDLTDAKWMPIREISERTQIMACTGPDRRTCFPCKDYVYAIVAERS